MLFLSLNKVNQLEAWEKNLLKAWDLQIFFKQLASFAIKDRNLD